MLAINWAVEAMEFRIGFDWAVLAFVIDSDALMLIGPYDFHSILASILVISMSATAAL